jgi:hypothetical protein
VRLRGWLVASLLTPTLAFADDKADCVSAYSSAQDLRSATHLVAARDQLKVCARPVCPTSLSTDCTQWLAEVESSLPTFVFTARDDAGNDVVAVHVSVDGKPVLDKLDGSALALDPGAHTVVFEMAGKPPIEKKILASVGEKNRSVAVTFHDATAEAHPQQPLPTQPPPPPVVLDPEQEYAKLNGVHIAFVQPDNAKWALLRKDGSTACEFPCSRWVAESSGMSIERQSGAQTTRFVVPPTFGVRRGGEARMVLRPKQGNPILAGILIGVGVAAMGVGAVAVVTTVQRCEYTAPPSGFSFAPSGGPQSQTISALGTCSDQPAYVCPGSAGNCYPGNNVQIPASDHALTSASSTGMAVGAVLLIAGALTVISGSIVAVITHPEHIEIIDSSTSSSSSIRFAPPFGISF